MIDFPSDVVPEKASRWDLSRIETCGGGKSISWTPLLVSRFLRIYSGGIGSNGAVWAPQATWARHPTWGAPWCLVGHNFIFWPSPEASSTCYVQKKISKKFRGIWTSFGTEILEKQKQAKNSNWHWALITHKYRGSIIAFWINKSVEPNEELDEDIF